MANQWNAPLWTDGDWTIHKAVSLPVFSAPIPGVKAKYSFTQDYQCFLKDYSPPVIGTAHPSAGKTPDYSSYVLCDEGEHKDLGGGVIRFTRKYAVPPQSWDDWETYAYNLIGMATGGLSPIRARLARNVSCRVRRDYFLSGVSAGNLTVTLQDGSSYTNSGGKVALPGNITTNRVTYYSADVTGSSTWNIANATDTINGTTLPTISDYQGMITDAFTDGWNSTLYSQTINASGDITASAVGGQLTVEDSKLTRWMGNIWMRETRYVLAQ